MYIQIIFKKPIFVFNTPIPVDRYSYHWYTILLGATRALAHIGVHFTHHVFDLSVAIDYFIKSIEADAFGSIKDKNVTQFICKNIFYRFSIPRSIVSYN